MRSRCRRAYDWCGVRDPNGGTEGNGAREHRSGQVTVGIRASALHLPKAPTDLEVRGLVALAEISGSDTFVHATTPIGDLVAQLTGVHSFDIGANVTLHLSRADVHVFDAEGALLHAPTRQGGH